MSKLTLQVYCFLMMVVPFVVIPLLTVIVGLLTMFKIGKVRVVFTFVLQH